MSSYIKEYRAGRYCRTVAYSRITSRDCPQARAEKQHHSSKAQQQLNDRLSRLQLTGIIAENFADSQTALFVSATFDGEHYPDCPKPSAYWAYCIQEAKKLIARLNYLAKRRGEKIKYVYWPGLGEGGRWHIHLLIDGVTGEDVDAAWKLGDVNYHNLYSDTKWLTDREWSTVAGNVNPVAIAKYAMHNARVRQVGRHPWHASRNCIRPKTSPARVIRDDRDIQPPEGAEIISQERVDTLYSSFIFLEYILPSPAPRKRPRRRKRKT